MNTKALRCNFVNLSLELQTDVKEVSLPYQFNGSRRHSYQFGVGVSSWGGYNPSSLTEPWLNAIPGGLAWLSLILVLIGAVKAPLVMLFGAAMLSIYTAVRFLFAGAAVILGLRYVKEWEQKDWCEEYERLKTPESLPLDKVHHLVIIPNYREDLETLCCTLDRLAEQSVASTNMTIMLAMESGEVGSGEKGDLLRRQYEHRFKHFFVAVHPRGIHQEMQCKSANEAWAARQAKKHLVEEMGYQVQHIVVTTMDADTLWHPRHMEALGVLFATDYNRYAAFWQAPIRYHSNIWEINPMMRLLHGYSTCWELAYLAAPWWPALPMSSYSLSLKLLDSVGYWDPDVIADEWHMYIKAFFHRDGDLGLRPIFLPFSANATSGKNLLDAIRQRYNQTLRHAWGAKEIGYTIAKTQEHPQVNRWESFNLLFRVAHDNLLAGAGWIIITAGTQLPALFHPHSVSEWTKTPVFILLQISFAIVTLLSLTFWVVDVRTRPPRLHPMTRSERFFSLIALPSLTIATLICVALPVLISQTRLMFSMPLQFRVTRKIFK